MEIKSWLTTFCEGTVRTGSNVTLACRTGRLEQRVLGPGRSRKSDLVTLSEFLSAKSTCTALRQQRP
jgi:hypothetical protein